MEHVRLILLTCLGYVYFTILLLISFASTADRPALQLPFVSFLRGKTVKLSVLKIDRILYVVPVSAADLDAIGSKKLDWLP